MNSVLQPWQLFVLILASWINRQQQQRIDYLETQFAVLREYVGDKRILLTDDQRRRLAVKGKGLDNKRIVPLDRPPDIDAEIETTERLAGLLRSYRRAA